MQQLACGMVRCTRTLEDRTRPPKINTAVTDSKGGLEIYLGGGLKGSINRKCCLDCLIKHKQSHLNDILASNPGIAIDENGKPYPKERGIVSSISERELLESEVKAYRTEIKYLNESLKKPKISKTCIKKINKRIQNQNAILKLYQDQLKKL